ncbi:hypothetical protein [Fusobacterium ulcerans]|nr:hypothetical protein [Fusobacterium ulcerans]
MLIKRSEPWYAAEHHSKGVHMDILIELAVQVIAGILAKIICDWIDKK